MGFQKKVSGDRRTFETEMEVPGTPETVWQALATGPGVTSWFVPSRVEEREGGALAFEVAPGVESAGVVLAWEPPRRFAYEEPNWNGEAPPVGTEFVIEGKSGGTCTVRLVHSLFTSRDDWDQEVEGFEAGWGSFFDVLRIYLRSFAGQPCSAARFMGRSSETDADAWKAFSGALGLAGLAAGERFATSDGVPRFAGQVERLGSKLAPNEILLRLDEPAPGIALLGAYAWGGNVHPAMSLFFYGPGAAAALEAEQPRWTAWMNEHFPTPPAEGAA